MPRRLSLILYAPGNHTGKAGGRSIPSVEQHMDAGQNIYSVRSHIMVGKIDLISNQSILLFLRTKVARNIFHSLH